jgi:hypothetical protein
MISDESSLIHLMPVHLDGGGKMEGEGEVVYIDMPRHAADY